MHKGKHWKSYKKWYRKRHKLLILYNQHLKIELLFLSVRNFRIEKELLITPSLISATSKHANCRYQVLSKGFEYFYTCPSPSSLVVTPANEESKQLGKSAPKEREPNRIDTFGRKIYSSACLQVRITNYQAMLSKYDYLQ